jgi:hypothetical protein
MESPALALFGFAGTMLAAVTLAAVLLSLIARIHVASGEEQHTRRRSRRVSLSLFSAGGLAVDLAHNYLAPRHKAYYLLGGWLLYLVLGYSTVTSSNASLTLVGLCELLVVAAVVVIGIYLCYEAGGGDENPHFLVDFTCLLLPITVQVYALVWGLYWALLWPYRLIMKIAQSRSLLRMRQQRPIG